MLITLFDKKRIIHKEFVPAGQMVNAAFYVEVLKHFLQCIQCVRPYMIRNGNWMLLHYNVPTHMSKFLTQRGEIGLKQYFPDLTLDDFCCVPQLKVNLKVYGGIKKIRIMLH